MKPATICDGYVEVSLVIQQLLTLRFTTVHLNIDRVGIMPANMSAFCLQTHESTVHVSQSPSNK